MNQTEWKCPTAAEVKKKWEDIVADMLPLRRSYWINHEYFMGNQWITWDDNTASAQFQPAGDNEDLDSRVTVNKFKPRTLSLLARFVRSPLPFEPRPEGVDAAAQRKASTQRQILEVEAHRAGWESERAEAVMNALLGGVSAISVEPDWEYENQSISLTETGEEIKLPKRPAVRLAALNAAEFGLEPGSRKASDAYYWMRVTTLTPSQAKRHYQLDYEPKPDADAATTSVMHRALIGNRQGAGLRSVSKACAVYVYYERPSSDGPGCVLHVIGDKIVRQSPWPFPFTDRLNIQPFIQTQVGATWKGETILNDARQIQRNINKAFTSMNRHVGKADNARMLVPMGSIVDDDFELSGQVAEVIMYDPSVAGGAGPRWMEAPQIPRWLREMVEKYESELDDLFSTHAVSRGEAPGDRNSGLALSILAEKDETPLGPMAMNQQRGWQSIAEMVLATMRHLMQQVDAARAKHGLPGMEVQDTLMRPDQSVVQFQWSAADLPEHPVVSVPLDAVMPRSQAAVMEQMLRLAQTFPEMFAGMTPGQLAAIIRTPDATAFAAIKDPQTALAIWENGRMLAGVGDDEVLVDSWHDHAKHIANHNDTRATSAYRDADPAVQEYIDLHIQAHETLMQQMSAPAPAPGAMPPGPEGPPPDGQMMPPAPTENPMEVAP